MFGNRSVAIMYGSEEKLGTSAIGSCEAPWNVMESLYRGPGGKPGIGELWVVTFGTDITGCVYGLVSGALEVASCGSVGRGGVFL